MSPSSSSTSHNTSSQAAADERSNVQPAAGGDQSTKLPRRQTIPRTARTPKHRQQRTDDHVIKRPGQFQQRIDEFLAPSDSETDDLKQLEKSNDLADLTGSLRRTTVDDRSISPGIQQRNQQNNERESARRNAREEEEREAARTDKKRRRDTEKRALPKEGRPDQAPTLLHPEKRSRTL